MNLDTVCLKANYWLHQHLPYVGHKVILNTLQIDYSDRSD